MNQDEAFENYYAGMTDAEILHVARNVESLVPTAQRILIKQMQSRQLDTTQVSLHIRVPSTVAEKPKISERRWLLEINDVNSARAAARRGANSALFLAVIMIVMASFSVFGETPLPFFDSALYLVLGVAMWRMSRTGAVLALLLYSASVIEYVVSSLRFSLLGILFVSQLVNGVRGTFAYHRFTGSNEIVEKVRWYDRFKQLLWPDLQNEKGIIVAVRAATLTAIILSLFNLFFGLHTLNTVARTKWTGSLLMQVLSDAALFGILGVFILRMSRVAAGLTLIKFIADRIYVNIKEGGPVDSAALGAALFTVVAVLFLLNGIRATIIYHKKPPLHSMVPQSMTNDSGKDILE